VTCLLDSATNQDVSGFALVSDSVVIPVRAGSLHQLLSLVSLDDVDFQECFRQKVGRLAWEGMGN
jgi:hypothetical protein